MHFKVHCIGVNDQSRIVLTQKIRLPSFLEAGLVIRRTPRPFHYQVVIEKLGEDDEEVSETEDAQDGALVPNKITPFLEREC